MANQSSATDRPHSLAKVQECLAGFQPPAGPFDPQGAWENRYTVWVVLPRSNFGTSQPMGAFHIRRRPAGPHETTLEITLATLQGLGMRTTYYADARVTCAGDPLATPRSWELRTVILDRMNKPIEGTEVRETGQVAGDVIRRRGNVERIIPAPKSFTSNWSLFDALQRLPGNGVQPLTFDLFEEMDLLKPNQRLAYRQSVEMKLDARRVKLHGFEQIGDGILPYTYWLDDQRRLLMAIGGLRAFLFDPSAKLPEVLG